MVLSMMCRFCFSLRYRTLFMIERTDSMWRKRGAWYLLLGMALGNRLTISSLGCLIGRASHHRDGQIIRYFRSTSISPFSRHYGRLCPSNKLVKTFLHTRPVLGSALGRRGQPTPRDLSPLILSTSLPRSFLSRAKVADACDQLPHLFLLMNDSTCALC
jgi:hypothetical protein